MNTDCRKTLDWMDDNPSSRAVPPEIELHLAGCETCLKARRESMAIAALAAQLTCVQAPDDFEARLFAKIARDSGSPQVLAPSFWTRHRKSLTAAAALIATAGALLVFRGVPGGVPTPVSSPMVRTNPASKPVPIPTQPPVSVSVHPTASPTGTRMASQRPVRPAQPRTESPSVRPSTTPLRDVEVFEGIPASDHLAAGSGLPVLEIPLPEKNRTLAPEQYLRFRPAAGRKPSAGRFLEVPARIRVNDLDTKDGPLLHEATF